MFGFKKKQQPFPEEWKQIITQHVPYFRRLPADKQTALQKRTQRFLREKNFEGCGGLSLTDEMKVTIATQACILILGSEDEMYPSLRSVLIYPEEYFANSRQTSRGGIITEGIQHRAGESWSYGDVVLAWNDVKAGADNDRDGRNLVFHEFAHQLDREFGATLRLEEQPHDDDNAWTRILRKTYRAFLNDVNHGRPTLIDTYGATNPAEFFAVTTECFFEKPLKLRKKHPELYEQFHIFYQQNPADYFE